MPLTSPLVLAARRRAIPVLAEIEIAWRIAEGEAPGKNRWVAITGTNGKSTTTAWIAEILQRAGRPVALAGNIGVPLSGFLSDRSPRDFVCEVSSFQLEAIERFAAHVAVLTNITPDHLDRYEGFEDYAARRSGSSRTSGPRTSRSSTRTTRPRVRSLTRARRVAFSRVESGSRRRLGGRRLARLGDRRSAPRDRVPREISLCRAPTTSRTRSRPWRRPSAWGRPRRRSPRA